jgi:dynein heavy chain
MVILLCCAGDSGGGISREEFIGKVAQEVLNKIPAEFELDKIKKKYGLEVTPTTVVLLQELERFNNLLNRMRKSLNTLQKVIQICFMFGTSKCNGVIKIF